MVLRNNRGYMNNTKELYGNTAQILRHIDHTQCLIYQIPTILTYVFTKRDQKQTVFHNPTPISQQVPNRHKFEINI